MNEILTNVKLDNIKHQSLSICKFPLWLAIIIPEAQQGPINQ